MYTVFTDESGSDIWDDRTQPVFGLYSVIFRDRDISKFERAAERLLIKVGLPPTTEIHCSCCVMRQGPFSHFTKPMTGKFLKRFVRIGMKYCKRVHYLPMNKFLTILETRKKLEIQKLDPFTVLFLFSVLTLDRYFEKKTNSHYRYLFDRNDKHKKGIFAIARKLQNHQNVLMKLHCMIGTPVEVDSAPTRGIQLADVIGYYVGRSEQLRIPKMRKLPIFRPELLKHEEIIRKINRMVESKKLNFYDSKVVSALDWEGMLKFSL